MTSCPIPGCHRFKKPQELMCKAHWWLVPKDLRDNVWIHWRAREKGRPGASELHAAAKREALVAAAAAGEPPQQELL